MEKKLPMSKADFQKLADLIKPYAKNKSSRVRKEVICLGKRVTITFKL